jgi:hypothetical protein
MGGFVFDAHCGDETVTAEKAPSKPPTNTRNTHYVPTPLAFIYIMKHFPHIIPDLPEEFITDRAESNSLSKALLIIQVGWFCMNCASRLIQQLPLSLLEVSTAAHSFCTLLTYFVWWSKPLNVAEGTTMKGKEAREVHALLMCSKMEYAEALRMAQRMAAGNSLMTTNKNEQGQIALAANALRHLLPIPESPPPEKPFHHHTWMSAPGSFRPESQPNFGYQWISVAVAPILYGLVHFLGWRGSFPTPPERLLWQASSVVVTFSGLLWVSLSLLAQAYFDQLKNYWARLILGVVFVILVIAVIPLAYILASGFLVIESFGSYSFWILLHISLRLGQIIGLTSHEWATWVRPSINVAQFVSRTDHAIKDLESSKVWCVDQRLGIMNGMHMTDQLYPRTCDIGSSIIETSEIHQ